MRPERRTDARSERPAKSAVPSVPLSPWEGAADPAYLLSEVEELRKLAEQSGLGTLAYLLECAAIECRNQVRLKENGRSST